MYMTTVGVAQLRQDLSKYLERVGRGERLLVADRNRPVAELGPPPATGEALDRLIAEGRVTRPLRRVLPDPWVARGSLRAEPCPGGSLAGTVSDGLFYLDTSALVKLVRREPGTPALTLFATRADLLSSELTPVELPRAIRRAAALDPLPSLTALLERTNDVLASIAMLPLGALLLQAAGGVSEPRLRSLAALHVASALHLAPIDGFISYDSRQAAAARLCGLRTIAPSANGGPRGTP